MSSREAVTTAVCCTVDNVSGMPAAHGDEDDVTLIWQNLTVTPVRSKSGADEQHPVLNDISGTLQPGTLVALMGPSGAGKTTLMSALAFRMSDRMTIAGDIRVNGCPIGPYMYNISGYIYQDELLPDSVTVQEHLQLMANLKLGKSVSVDRKRAMIADILSRTGLERCANTKIANASGIGKTLSGGEKKRLAFAVELLSKPKFLFCDEPTTGLDSYSASRLVEMMKSLTRTGTTVLCSIHQPAEKLLHQFDSLILLTGGRTGFIGTPTEAVQFFRLQGLECEAGYNTADFLIKVLSSTTTTTRKGNQFTTGAIGPKTICNNYCASEAARRQETLISAELYRTTVDGGDKAFQKRLAKSRGRCWFYTLYWLMYRHTLQSHRNPNLQYFKIIQRIAIAVLVGLCFSDAIELSQRGVQAMQGVIFLIVSENTFLPMYAALSMFPDRFPLFQREKKANLYSTAQFYISSIMSMTPFVLLETCAFILIVYFLANLRPTLLGLLVTVAVSVLVMNVSIACGCFFSTLFPTVASAMSYLVPFDYILMITSGIFIKIWSMPTYLRWMPFISWMMFASEAISIAQWDGVKSIECSNIIPSVCLHNGEQVLDQYSFSSKHLRTDLVVLVGQYFIYHLLAMLCLARRVASYASLMLSPMDPTVNSTGSSASADYRKKRIKNVQKLELVRLMKANFLFIRGKHAVARSEKSRADVWKVITGRLNSLGPPVQSAEAWQRRWNDMRSATKSKMAKIQNYVREHGEDCPYKLNLVERLIWDTFSVKPEEYMKDLNMKLWREKQQRCAGTVGDSLSSCSSQMSTEPSFEAGWNQAGTTCHDTGTGWNSAMPFAPSSNRANSDAPMEDTNRTGGAFYPTASSSQPGQSYQSHQSLDMGYSGYSSSTSTNGSAHQRTIEPMNQWISATSSSEEQSKMTVAGSTDLVPGSKVLRELNKLFDLVLRQNEEILALLRQPTNEQEGFETHTGNYPHGGKPSMDIQLLNDDQERAILSDLCKAAGPESTPLTTFSYISEYICSNNIDIWPGEIASSSDAAAKLEYDNGDVQVLC
uniref:Regulatory protein zeste n=1 Tax=Anopheles epiroticus TaxID=199890 RepID=A0A182PSF7_9DIPT